MKLDYRIARPIFGAVLVFFSTVFSQTAFAIAGKFQFVNGNVQVINAAGESRTIKKGDMVDAGETVSSSPDGFAQIRMEDGGFFAVRPNTQFRIDTFKYEGKEDGNEKGIFSLIKGSLRSVTGIIGKKHKDNYKIQTATSTIGIRGSGADVGFDPAIGTALQTLFGGHSLTSLGVTVETRPGQVALAPPGGVPVIVPNFPFSIATNPGGSNQGGNGSRSSNSASPTQQQLPTPTIATRDVVFPVVTTGGIDLTNNSGFSVAAPDGSGGVRVSVFDTGEGGLAASNDFGVVGKTDISNIVNCDCVFSSEQISVSANLDTRGVLTSFETRREFEGEGTSVVESRFFSVGSAALTVDGRNNDLGVVWGRWGTGYNRTLTITTEDTSTSTPPTTTTFNPATVGELAFITATHITTPTELAALNITGTYTLAPGNFPTLVNGLPSGTLTSASATVDFSSGVVNNFSVAGSGGGFGTWNASAISPTAIGAFSRNGIDLSGTCAGGSGACAQAGSSLYGNAVGGFVGAQARGLITGINANAAGDILTGAALLTR